jgi:serine/threonine-protein kinase HipA
LPERDRPGGALSVVVRFELPVAAGAAPPLPRTRLMLRRFDREKVEGGYYRHRMASALTILDAEGQPNRSDELVVLLLADELQRWSSRPREDKAELYRRVVFNALISNDDNHPRNHTVVAASSEWRLAPAFDLMPSRQVGRQERDLALVCGPYGTRATRQNLVSAAARFGLTTVDASGVIDRMIGIVRRCWRPDVISQGGTEVDCARVEHAFVHAGFEHAADA